MIWLKFIPSYSEAHVARPAPDPKLPLDFKDQARIRRRR
jgi:hypothetical protein